MDIGFYVAAFHQEPHRELRRLFGVSFAAMEE